MAENIDPIDRDLQGYIDSVTQRAATWWHLLKGWMPTFLVCPVAHGSPWGVLLSNHTAGVSLASFARSLLSYFSGLALVLFSFSLSSMPLHPQNAYIHLLLTWPIQIQLILPIFCHMSMPLMKYSFYMGYFWSTLLCPLASGTVPSTEFFFIMRMLDGCMNEWLSKWLHKKAILPRIFYQIKDHRHWGFVPLKKESV